MKSAHGRLKDLAKEQPEAPDPFAASRYSSNRVPLIGAEVSKHGTASLIPTLRPSLVRSFVSIS